MIRDACSFTNYFSGKCPRFLARPQECRMRSFAVIPQIAFVDACNIFRWHTVSLNTEAGHGLKYSRFVEERGDGIEEQMVGGQEGKSRAIQQL